MSFRAFAVFSAVFTVFDVFAAGALVFTVEDVPAVFDVLAEDALVFAEVFVFADDALVFTVEDVPAVFDIFAADVFALVFGVLFVGSMDGASVIASEDSVFLRGEIVITPIYINFIFGNVNLYHILEYNINEFFSGCEFYRAGYRLNH